MRKVYNKQDERDFGSFEPVPCKAGQVRITQPHLPHGALGPAQGPRRTILPWYVRVQDDNTEVSFKSLLMDRAFRRDDEVLTFGDSPPKLVGRRPSTH